MLVEYEQSGKASVFVDNRIGEQNATLGEFDKAILRSQRERQVCASLEPTSDYLLNLRMLCIRKCKFRLYS